MNMDKINKLKEMINDSDRIVFFGGAGVSTESGIPDFRSEAGLYKAKQDFGYSPEQILSATFFHQHPDIFFEYYQKNMVYPDAKPNAAHLALSKLEAAGKLTAVITQNIDGLHQKSGSKNVYELHGSELRNYCTTCGKDFDLEYVTDHAHCLDKDDTYDHIPKCDACGSMIKPDVVLYEEALNQDVMSGAAHAISVADMLIVGGTSLVVWPAAGFLNYFKGKYLVLINKGETSYDERADLVIHEAIGEVLGNLL